MNMVLVGKEAPNIVGTAVMASNEFNTEFDLKKYLDGHNGIVFFYPLDFTFVCPTEIIAFNHRVGDFMAKNTKVVAVSVDSHFTHLAWKKTAVSDGGVGNIQFPMVTDITKQISKDYGVLINDAVALRGTFLIDKNFIIRHQLVNDLPLGRNVDETLRMVDALNYFEEHGEVCPAGWKQGDVGMTPTAEGVSDYLTSNADKL